MSNNPRVISEADVENTEVKLTNQIQHRRKDFTREAESNQMIFSVYEIAPGKSNWPYHYHMGNEELFYILEGAGDLRTPNGTKKIKAGDFIHCLSGPEGAHQLINTSDTKVLKYIDVGTTKTPDAVVMPDSNKIGVFAGSAPGQKKEKRYFWKYFNLDNTLGYIDNE